MTWPDVKTKEAPRERERERARHNLIKLAISLRWKTSCVQSLTDRQAAEAGS